MPRRRLPTPYLNCRRWTTEDARAALAAWDASGMSMSAFAQREGLEVQRLYRWRRQLADVPAAPRTAEFVELRPRGLERERVEVILRTGRMLRVSETIDPSLLARLADALEAPSAC